MPRPNSIPLETLLHVRDSCLCLYTQRAARALARSFDDAFRPLELTNGQFSLLMVLNQPEPPPMGRIAKFLAMDRTTLTAALKPLQRRGLVEVSPGQQDRRSRVMALTPAGRKLLPRAVEIWKEHHVRVEAKLATGMADAVRAALNRLTAELTAELESGKTQRAPAGTQRRMPT